jgi:flagellar biosynthesis/type III secretory pathway protein FliH
MRESSTYQAILREGKAEGIAEGKAEGMAAGMAAGMAEGRTEEARRLLLRLGRKHLGPPAPKFEAMVEKMTELERIEELSERTTDVSTWEELFAES